MRSAVDEVTHVQPRKRGIPVWAWVLMVLSSVTLVVAVIGIAVMVGGGSTTVTPAAQTSKNATACKFFEDGYNQLTDAVRLKLARDALIEAKDMLPSRMKDAADKAEGDVARGPPRYTRVLRCAPSRKR